MRSIRREHRHAVFERLEGWWNAEVIKQMTGKKDEGVLGFEVSDKISALSEEYKLDNLPITFRGKEPAGEINTETDLRTFVVQLREIGVSSSRIRNAILDYYRAYEQRSEWARENQQSGNIESLRLRARVTEPYVTRGSFHILADAVPEPRVYWHPRFLDRLGEVLGVSK